MRTIMETVSENGIKIPRGSTINRIKRIRFKLYEVELDSGKKLLVRQFPI